MPENPEIVESFNTSEEEHETIEIRELLAFVRRVADLSLLLVDSTKEYDIIQDARNILAKMESR